MKHLFILLLCLTTSLITSAQYEGEAKFGLIGGVNLVFTEGDDWEDYIDDIEDNVEYYNSGDFDLKTKIGMHLGMSLDYFLKDNLAINSGLIYSQKGFTIKTEMESYDYDYYNPSYTNIETTLDMTFNYIDMPIALKYISDDGFQIYGGFLFSFLMSDNADMDVDGTGYDYDSDYDDFEDLYGRDAEDSTTGMFVGVGFDLSEKMNLSLKVQKTGSFGKTGYGDENNNLTVQLSTGIAF